MRHAGQALVQIAEDRSTRIEYAMKFFLSRPAFEHELSLYMDGTRPLGAFLPEVHSIVDPMETQFVDAAGVPLPPCIVMEKGESLDKWAASCSDGLDMVTGLQARPARYQKMGKFPICWVYLLGSAYGIAAPPCRCVNMRSLCCPTFTSCTS